MTKKVVQRQTHSKAGSSRDLTYDVGKASHPRGGSAGSSRSSSLPPIRTDWVKAVSPMPGVGMAGTTMDVDESSGGPTLYAKQGMLTGLVSSNIVDVDKRMGGAQENFVRFPRMSQNTGRLMDTEDGPNLSQKRLDERRSVERTTLPHDFTEQHHNIGKIPPLELHVVDPAEKMGETFTWAHDPSMRDSSKPYARTRQGREARVAIPMEQGGMFVCELDRAAMDGSLASCVAGETYIIGVSLRYGYGAAKTGTDLDRQMLEDWMHKMGGLSAYLTGPADIPCNCTHVSEGAYSFSFSASKVGEYQLWIFAGSNPVPGSPFRVGYVAGPPHPRGCTVLGLGLWTSECGREAEFEWTARDKHSNQIVRGGHEFEVKMLGPEELTIDITDYGNGTYRARYTPTIAGQHRISIQYKGEHLAGSPFLVTVKEGAADPSMSTVTGEGLDDCNVGSDRHFLVEAVDRFGNRVLHGGDKFVAEMRGPVPERVHLIDMDDGTYAGTYMCRWSGDFALYVTLDGTPVGQSPYMVGVKPGATLAQNCECTLVKMPMSRLVCMAGVQCSFVIFAKDRYGNQREEGGDEFTVKCRGPSAQVGAVLTDNKDGTYLAEFMCTKDGDYFIDVKLERIDIIQSPFVLTVDPAKTEPSCCTCFGVETEAGDGLKGGEAGRELVFRIQAMDKFMNRVQTPGDDFQVSITEVIEKIRVRAKVIDNGDGTYEVTWVGMIRGEYDVSVFLLEEEIRGSPWKAMVTTGKAAPEKCTAEGVGLGGSQAGTLTSVLLESNDHYGNVVTKGGAELEGTLVSVDGKSLHTCNIDDHNDGTYTLYYEAEKMGDYFLAVRMEGQHIHESPFLVFIDHTDSDPQHCIADGRHDSGDGLKSCVVGVETGFVLVCADRFGNKCSVGGDEISAELRGAKNVTVEVLDHQDGHYTLSYTAIWAGLYKLHVLLGDDDVYGSPFAIVAETAGIHPPSCYVHGTGIYACEAGVEAQFHVQTKDKFDNVRPEEDELEVKISGPEKVAILRRYLGDGQYDFFWTANTAGQYEVDIQNKGVSLATAPYSANVGPGKVFPINCVAEGSGIKEGVAGETQVFSIQSKDMYGNKRTTGGDRFVISISGPSSCEAKIRDKDDGSYACTWSAMIKGTYWIQISLNGDDISGSPYFCEIFPADVDVANCTAEGMGLLAIKTGQLSRFTIHSVDRFGNHLDKGGDPWEVKIDGMEVIDDAEVHDERDGTYTVTYKSDMKGNLQVMIGIRGRDLPDCPFDVISDVKLRRKEALKRLEEKRSLKAKKGRKKQVEVEESSSGSSGEEEEEGNAPGPSRGQKVV
uniref:Ig-like domain-containing protein n=3 Tax=Hemiselmis andersenii TaxID=464988 RepID=A0A7S1DTW6_HEMAN|mmetsp:Transcript_2760/g.6498  ORF Transcript_2760/g.6498 Transcript_2760/m.6498 type:complete len:1313 (+) Transcript_2760:89-4027(+)